MTIVINLFRFYQKEQINHSKAKEDLEAQDLADMVKNLNFIAFLLNL